MRNAGAVHCTESNWRFTKDTPPFIFMYTWSWGSLLLLPHNDVRADVVAFSFVLGLGLVFRRPLAQLLRTELACS
jgi:hypothetical protein